MIPRSPSSFRRCTGAGTGLSRRLRPSRPQVPPQVDRSRPSEPSAHPGEPSPTSATRPRTTRRAAVGAFAAAAAVLLAGGLWMWTHRPASQGESVVRVNVTFPAAQAPVPSVNAHPIVTVSPDGQRIVYVGGEPDKARLFLREMNRFDAVPLPGTEGAHGPFFSPDGNWVAFFAQGTLKKLRITGEPRTEPQLVCATDTGVGGTWVSANEIVFAPNWRGPLMRVPAAGGKTVPFTPPAGTTYRWPDRLDDRTVLATRWRSSADDAAVVAISLTSGAERVIASPATFGRAAPGGYVVFLRDGDLHAVRLDSSGHGPQGPPVRVVSSVMTGTTGAAQFAISPHGSLLYIEDIPERSHRTLARADGRGGSAIFLFRRGRSTTSPRAAIAWQPRSLRVGRRTCGPAISIARR